MLIVVPSFCQISTFVGHTLSGSRRGTVCVNTAEPRTMLFEGRRFGIGEYRRGQRPDMI